MGKSQLNRLAPSEIHKDSYGKEEKDTKTIPLIYRINSRHDFYTDRGVRWVQMNKREKPFHIHCLFKEKKHPHIQK